MTSDVLFAMTNLEILCIQPFWIYSKVELFWKNLIVSLKDRNFYPTTILLTILSSWV